MNLATFRLLCLGAIAAALTVATGTAATYHVRNDGNDAADGLSDAGAWASIARVNAQKFAPGDFILLKRGSTWTGTTLVVSSAGLSGRPITFGAYGPGTDRPVISAPGQTGFQANDHDHITVEDLELRNCQNGLDSSRNHHTTVRRLKIVNVVQNGMAFKQGGHHAVDACEVTGFGAGGIHFKGSDVEPMHDVVVTNCRVRDAHPGTHPDGIVIHQASSPGTPEAGAGFVLRGNFASNAGEQGFDITTGSDILLEDNVTENNRAGAITIGHTARRVTVRRHFSRNEPAANSSAALTISGPDITVEYSVFSGAAASKRPLLWIKPSREMSAVPPAADSQPENIRVLNNVFVWNSTAEGSLFLLEPLRVGQRGASPYVIPATLRHLTMKNNIFVATAGAAGVMNFEQADRPPDFSTFDIDHNLYHAPAGMTWRVGGATLSFAEYQGKHARDRHGLVADPRFVDPAGGNFHLQTGPTPSPAIDAGATVALTQALDLDREPVPAGRAPEIGADEVPVRSTQK